MQTAMLEGTPSIWPGRGNQFQLAHVLRFKNYPDELILQREVGGDSRALGVGVVVQIQPFLNHEQRDLETGKGWLCRAHCLAECKRWSGRKVYHLGLAPSRPLTPRGLLEDHIGLCLRGMSSPTAPSQSQKQESSSGRARASVDMKRLPQNCKVSLQTDLDSLVSSSPWTTDRPRSLGPRAQVSSWHTSTLYIASASEKSLLSDLATLSSQKSHACDPKISF